MSDLDLFLWALFYLYLFSLHLFVGCHWFLFHAFVLFIHQSIVLNLGISPGFGTVDLVNLAFPATFHIDYVRVYQHPNRQSISCDPPDMPTATYIKK